VENGIADDDWEDELDMRVLQPKSQICDWVALHEQINDDIKMIKTLPQRQLNQLLIIRNFATLCLKGFPCTNASIEVARQWHEGEGIYFARQIWALA
jgi:hypothetical protein